MAPELVRLGLSKVALGADVTGMISVSTVGWEVACATVGECVGRL